VDPLIGPDESRDAGRKGMHRCVRADEFGSASPPMLEPPELYPVDPCIFDPFCARTNPGADNPSPGGVDVETIRARGRDAGPWCDELNREGDRRDLFNQGEEIHLSSEHLSPSRLDPVRASPETVQ